MRFLSTTRSAAFILVQLVLAGVSCSDAGSEPSPLGSMELSTPDAPASPSPEPVSPAVGSGDTTDTSENGQTGSVGGVECIEDLDCFAGALEQTIGPIGRVELLGSACTHLSYETVPVCECRMQLTKPAVGGMPAESYEVAAHPGHRSGDCSEWSIAPGCSYCASEFPGCSVDDPASCDAVCAVMTERRDADYRKTFVAKARLSRCAPEGGRCQVVTQIDGRCYAGPPERVEPPEVDCGLSDEELIAHLDDPPAQYCSVAPIACSSASDCPRGLACNAGVCGGCSDACSPVGPNGDYVCEGDAACASGELCTLGRCLPSANIGCRFDFRCAANEACVLSGFSSEGRGNAATRSFCQASPP